MTSCAFLPSGLGILMVPAGGCFHLTSGITMGHKGEGSSLGTYGSDLLGPSKVKT